MVCLVISEIEGKGEKLSGPIPTRYGLRYSTYSPQENIFNPVGDRVSTGDFPVDLSVPLPEN